MRHNRDMKLSYLDCAYTSNFFAINYQLLTINYLSVIEQTFLSIWIVIAEAFE
jgi:hypothetical protein